MLGQIESQISLCIFPQYYHVSAREETFMAQSFVDKQLVRHQPT